jgi:hypothetical protein
MEAAFQPRKLNDAQLMLVNLFSKDLSKEDMGALKNLLLDFYENMVQREIERLASVKDVSQNALDLLQTEHPVRTPYQS